MICDVLWKPNDVGGAGSGGPLGPLSGATLATVAPSGTEARELPAPITAVIRVSVIMRGYPTCAYERRPGPISGMPGVACSDRIPVTADPSITRAGSREPHKLKPVGRGERRTPPPARDNRRARLPLRELGKKAASGQQCQGDQFGLHCFLLFVAFSGARPLIMQARLPLVTR